MERATRDQLSRASTSRGPRGAPMGFNGNLHQCKEFYAFGLDNSSLPGQAWRSV
jgi:hypothetical protein